MMVSSRVDFCMRTTYLVAEVPAAAVVPYLNLVLFRNADVFCFCFNLWRSSNSLLMVAGLRSIRFLTKL